MAGHTPGPWHLELRAGFFCVVAGSIHSVGQVVARLAGKEDEEALANARLIAAAPILLATLQELKPILDRAESNASGNMEWDDVSKRIEAARAAIAKATTP